MKTLVAQLTSVVGARRSEGDLRALGRFFLILAAMITVYSVLFHVLMLREGQEHSWLTGFYWTLTVMSTLGFGDITF
ncbi:MAG: ion channel, partial [Acidobacteriota bacterium]